MPSLFRIYQFFKVFDAPIYLWVFFSFYFLAFIFYFFVFVSLPIVGVFTTNKVWNIFPMGFWPLFSVDESLFFLSDSSSVVDSDDWIHCVQLDQLIGQSLCCNMRQKKCWKRVNCQNLIGLLTPGLHFKYILCFLILSIQNDIEIVCSFYFLFVLSLLLLGRNAV